MYCFNSQPKKKGTKNLQTRVTRPSALPPSNNTHAHLDFGGVYGVQLLPEPLAPRTWGWPGGRYWSVRRTATDNWTVLFKDVEWQERILLNIRNILVTAERLQHFYEGTLVKNTYGKFSSSSGSITIWPRFKYAGWLG